MKVEKNTVYHIPTEEIKRDFLTKCEEQGFKWCDGSPALSEMRKIMYGTETCINTSDGRMMYGNRDYYGYSFITWKIDKSKPTIIKLPNNHKIVINKPYTIYTDGKVTGKAKCNPEDEWNTEIGIQVAVLRYKSNKQFDTIMGFIGVTPPPPKTIQDRFPIGSTVKVVKKSNYPRTAFSTGTVARVIGHYKSEVFGELVRCESPTNLTQAINPDDLRLING